MLKLTDILLKENYEFILSDKPQSYILKYTDRQQYRDFRIQSIRYAFEDYASEANQPLEYIYVFPYFMAVFESEEQANDIMNQLKNIWRGEITVEEYNGEYDEQSDNAKLKEQYEFIFSDEPEPEKPKQKRGQGIWKDFIITGYVETIYFHSYSAFNNESNIEEFQELCFRYNVEMELDEEELCYMAKLQNEQDARDFHSSVLDRFSNINDVNDVIFQPIYAKA